jgi:hypothetical protein
LIQKKRICPCIPREGDRVYKETHQGVVMSNNIFDLEQQLLSCWHVTDDIKLAAEYFINSTDFKDLPPKYSDKIMNILFGIQEVYELRFQKCFETFEKTVREYHTLNNTRESFDEML